MQTENIKIGDNANGLFTVVDQSGLKKTSEESDHTLKKACSDFEAIFLNMMLKSMRKTVPNDGIFKKDMEKDIYESMYDQQIVTKISQSNQGIGLSEMLYHQLQK